MSEDPLLSRKDYELVIVTCGVVDELVGHLSEPNSYFLTSWKSSLHHGTHPQALSSSFISGPAFLASLFLPAPGFSAKMVSVHPVTSGSVPTR